MNGTPARELSHRHGRRTHSHAHRGPHRRLTAPRLSEPAHEHAHVTHEHGHDHGHDGGHGHSHGLVDASIKRSREGIRAVLLSLAVLGVAAVAQTVIFVASGSIALLADLIHNFGDALTAVPLGIAFALRSDLAERRAGPRRRRCDLHQRMCGRGRGGAAARASERADAPARARDRRRDRLCRELHRRKGPYRRRAAVGQRRVDRRRRTRARGCLRQPRRDRLCARRRRWCTDRRSDHRPVDLSRDPAGRMAVMANRARPRPRA